MGQYLERLRRAPEYELNEFDEKRGRPGDSSGHSRGLISLIRLFRTLESIRPDYVSLARWQQAAGDGERFLARWGEQAASLGWTEADLFRLHVPPDAPHPSYERLARSIHESTVASDG
jgi:hypothetical protein